ncbi:MAG: Chromate resistance protein ChrB [Acidimicrobiales bacterium]
MRWLLITVSTSGDPSSLRVHVWRKLKSLGALYLQQSVCLLPERADTTRAVNRLLDRVRHEGGDGRSVRIAILEPSEEQAIIGAFRAERADEYIEVCSRTPAFMEEIESERAKGRTTYAEVEESEADLDRLRTWLSRIKARDYFEAEGGDEAAKAVDTCARTLAAFEADALAADSTAGAPVRPKSTQRLRAVNDE